VSVPLASSSTSPRSRRRLTGRIAGLSLAGGGVVTFLSLSVGTPEDAKVLGLLLVALAAIVLGGVVWLLPWERWHWSATLSVIPVAFTLIALRNFFSPVTVAPSVFFVVTFAWIGVGYGRFTSLLFAPVATAAYLLPFVARSGVPADYRSAAVVIPACVLIGETMAWIAERLRRSERALRDSERRYADAYEREREAVQRLDAQDQARNAFLTAVAHELRTPAAAVLGFASTLERTDPFLSDQDRTEMVHRLARGARRLHRLLADLLDLDRIARGLLAPDLQEVDLEPVVRRAVAESEIADHPVEVRTEPVLARADPVQVERIVENLLMNAARHTPAGTQVWVDLSARDGGALLAVEDAGPGIPDGLGQAIFEPFSQGPSVPQHAPGVGIGLTVVAQFTRLQGGRVWVEERPGGGARFLVLLPAAAAALPAGDHAMDTGAPVALAP
jgi:signal transduction histidine kinase